MTKKDFIALADEIRSFNECSDPDGITATIPFSEFQIGALANVCEGQNPAFNRSRWLDYIAGKCGKNGGKV
jgi:hypothetical protein